MAEREKDGWDKLDIVFRPLGGFATAIAVASLGYFGSGYLKERESLDTNARLYAQLMSQREQSDSTLRKDMFDSMIKAFLDTSEAHPAAGWARVDPEVLNLELLALNFHDALHLAPLFHSVDRHIKGCDCSPAEKQELGERIERVAKEVTLKQIGALEGPGGKLEQTFFFDEFDKAGLPVIDSVLIDDTTFSLTVTNFDRDRKELEVSLSVLEKDRSKDRGKAAEPPDPDENRVPSNPLVMERVFRVGFFDFPMVDNTRLSGGWRAAVVLRDFFDDRADITLLYFPGSRASLQEKPYYDEVIEELRGLHGTAAATF